jgi:hypothetical protein
MLPSSCLDPRPKPNSADHHGKVAAMAVVVLQLHEAIPSKLWAPRGFGVSHPGFHPLHRSYHSELWASSEVVRQTMANS